MPLTWDITKCPNREIIDNGVLTTVIWLMMPVGQPEISAKNVDLVWNRLSLMQRLAGPFMSMLNEKGERVEVPLERKHVEDLIGLRVNVAPITDAQFLKNVYRHHCEDRAREKREAAKVI